MYPSSPLQYGTKYHFNGPLDDFIDCVFVENFFSRSGNQGRWVKIVPDNTIELIFTRHAFRRSLLAEQTERKLETHLSGLKNKPQWVWLTGSPLITIRFKPGKLHFFTRVAAHHLINTSLSPEEVFGNEILHLEEKLFESASPFDRLSHIEKFFIAKLGSNYSTDPDFEKIIRLLEKKKGNGTISDLLNNCSIGQRQLEKKFKKYIGLSPKKYCRLLRFVHLVKHQQKYALPKLTDLAYQFDFYDQSHFNHEIENFTSQTPKQFFSSALGIQDDIF